ncbi:hypothetical protein C8R48DRAFT_743324 [Suillus tomentosus]|nr:hypothetical protein C8R48DRAFT_743324 [Suillus tomentosus]
MSTNQIMCNTLIVIFASLLTSLLYRDHPWRHPHVLNGEFSLAIMLTVVPLQGHMLLCIPM